MWDKVVRNVLQAVGVVSMIIVFHTLLMSGVCPAKQYSSGDVVDPAFSIAISDNGNPGLVAWSQYQQDKASFADRLIQLKDVDSFDSSSNELRVTQEGDVITVFNLAERTNRSWSSYRITGDSIEPVSFKLPQRFYIAAIFLAVLTFWMLKVLYERQILRRSLARDS